MIDQQRGDFFVLLNTKQPLNINPAAVFSFGIT